MTVVQLAHKSPNAYCRRQYFLVTTTAGEATNTQSSKEEQQVHADHSSLA